MAYMDTTLANLPADGCFAATVADVTYFGNMQNEIYLTGLSGAKPALPMTAAGLEDAAREQLSPEAFGYIAGSASTERTAESNLRAFDKHAIVPRMLRGTAAPDARDLSVEVLGTRLAAPILTAPVGVLGLVHDDAEVAVGSVTAELGIGSILSTAASSTIEDVAAASGENWWYQLYWPADDELAESFVRRAETAGAKAIVLTADTPGMVGVQGISNSVTFRSCRRRVLPTTCRIRCSAPNWPRRPRRAQKRCRSRFSRGCRCSAIMRCGLPISRNFASGRHFRSQ